MNVIKSLQNDTPENRKVTLSVVAIAKNERRDIEGFINNLCLWVDEIIIVDDFSTDGTFEFLLGAVPLVKVFQRKLERENGGFSAQRNAGLAIAAGDWVLHMDIDERVPPELAHEMLAAIEDTKSDAFRYRRMNFFLHRPFNAGGWETWNAPQLCRRGQHRFSGAVHETIELDRPDAIIGQLKGMMWHLNDETYVERMYKNAQYSQFSADQIVKSGARIGWSDLLFVPLKRSLKSYFFRGAWRHGETGLLFSLYVFCGTFNWYAIAWDQQQRIERKDLEESLSRRWQKWRKSDAH